MLGRTANEQELSYGRDLLLSGELPLALFVRVLAAKEFVERVGGESFDLWLSESYERLVGRCIDERTKESLTAWAKSVLKVANLDELLGKSDAMRANRTKLLNQIAASLDSKVYFASALVAQGLGNVHPATRATWPKSLAEYGMCDR